MRRSRRAAAARAVTRVPPVRQLLHRILPLTDWQQHSQAGSSLLLWRLLVAVDQLLLVVLLLERVLLERRQTRMWRRTLQWSALGLIGPAVATDVD